MGGFGAEPGQAQQDLRPFNSRKTQLRRFQRLASEHTSERFVKNNTEQLLGIPLKLIFL